MSIVRFSRRRRGVTLLITLSVIAAMLALVGLLFGYVDRARNEAEFKSSLTQANLLRADLAGVLKKVLKKKPSTDTLQLVYTTPLYLQPARGEFMVMARCSPLLNRLRISWLGKNPDGPYARHRELALRVFERLTERAELKDPAYLLELIRRSLKGKTVRFGREGDLQKKVGIIGPKEFQRLLDDYRFEQDDPNVYRIVWTPYFVFEDPGSVKGLDAEFMTPELLAALFDIDPTLIREGFTPGKLKDFLTSVGANEKEYDWLFAKGTVVAMECRASYSYRERPLAFHFDYIAQRIERFGIAND
jgi:hypothetical protein